MTQTKGVWIDYDDGHAGGYPHFCEKAAPKEPGMTKDELHQRIYEALQTAACMAKNPEAFAGFTNEHLARLVTGGIWHDIGEVVDD